MKKKSSPPANTNLPVSKQTAGGVAGAIIGGVIGGPVGAVAGAIAGTMMGNRAAEGKTLVSSGTVNNAKSAVDAVKAKLPSLKKTTTPSKTEIKVIKPPVRKATAARKPAPKAKAPSKAKAAPAKRRK